MVVDDNGDDNEDDNGDDNGGHNGDDVYSDLISLFSPFLCFDRNFYVDVGHLGIAVAHCFWKFNDLHLASSLQEAFISRNWIHIMTDISQILL